MRPAVKNFTEKLSLDAGLSLPPIFQQKYIHSLNGIRALAIMFVIIDHLRYGSICPCIFYDFNDYMAVGSFGVQIFFVISGFLITGLLLREKVLTGTINLKKFWIRRAIRILPAFYFFLLAVLLLKVAHIAVVNYKSILAASLFVSNFGNFHNQWLIAHTWSLSVEEQFYLCLPLIFIILPRRYYFIFVVIIAYYILYYYLRLYPILFVFRFFFITAPSLVIGALLAISLYKGWLKKIHPKLMHPLLAFSIVFAILIYLPRTFNIAPLFYRPFDYILSSVFIATFIYYAINCSPRNALYKFLNFSIICHIGILSYSIYLWQQLFFAKAINYNTVHPYWIVFPANVIFIGIAALISYYMIERPFLKLKKHFR